MDYVEISLMICIFGNVCYFVGLYQGWKAKERIDASNRN